MAKQNQKNLNKYINRIEAAESDRDTKYKDKWARFYKRWRNIVDQLVDEKGKVIKDRSNISIPQTFVQVETILPRLVETLFAARPYVSVKGRPKDLAEYQAYKALLDKPWEKSAVYMEALLDFQQNTVFDIQDKFHTGLKIMCLYGTTVGYVGWKFQEKKRIRKQLAQAHVKNEETGQLEPLLGEDNQPIMSYQPFEETETVYDDPDARFLDLGIFFTDPDAEDIDDAQYCGHISFESKEYLQSMHDQGIWNIDWKKVPKSSSKRNMARDYRQSQIGMPSSDDNVHDDEMSLYEVHHYWEDDLYVVLINRGYIAREGSNPFWHHRKPYVKDVYTKDPGQFYGLGLIEMIEDLQDELNVERNQRIDYRSASLRRTFTQRRGAEITPKNWEIKPYGRILVDDHDDIKEWEMKPVSGDSFTQEHIIKQDMQDTTGAQDVVIGTSQSGETATTTMSKDNNAAMRFKIIISSCEKRLLVGMSRLMIQLNQQFVTDARLIDIDGDQGDQFMEITPEDIQGEYRLMPAGTSVEPMANKEAHKQRLVEFYTIASHDPLMQHFPGKLRNLLEKVLQSFDIEDTEELLPSELDIEQLQHPVMPPAGNPNNISVGGGQTNMAAQTEQGLQMPR